jgi:PAS domain S-box-containing protein
LVRCTLYWVLSWVGISLIVVALINDANEPGATVMMFLGLPIVMCLAYLVVHARRRHLELTPLGDLNGAEEVELKARFLLEEFVEYKRQQQLWSGGVGPNAASGSGGSAAQSGGLSAVSMAMAGVNAGGPFSGDSVDDHDERLLSPEDKFAAQLKQAETLYDLGCRRFPSSTMFLLRAQFYFFYLPSSKVIALSALTRAENRDPGLDEMFSIYYFHRLNEDTFSTEGGNRDVIAFIEYNKYSADAKRWDEDATRYQLRFWDTLLEPEPDLFRLSMLAGRINSAIAKAQDAFRRLMKLTSASPSPEVLRMYASFLMDVASDERQGQLLLKRAEEAEETRMHENTAEQAQGGSFDDRSASIYMNCNAKDPGTILSANAVALQMFGYSRAEMEGRNVSMIMPAPYSQYHTAFLRRYLDSGSAQSLNVVRELYAVHKNGFVFPIKLSIREVTTSAGTSFLGLIQATKTTDHFCFLDPSLTVTSCSAGLATLHGVSIGGATGAGAANSGSNASAQRVKSLKLDALVPNFCDIKEQLATPEGCCVDVSTSTGAHYLRVWSSELTMELENWLILRFAAEQRPANAKWIASGRNIVSPGSSAKNLLSPVPISREVVSPRITIHQSDFVAGSHEDFSYDDESDSGLGSDVANDGDAEQIVDDAFVPDTPGRGKMVPCGILYFLSIHHE